jgi:hypothetical protein
MDCLSLNAQIVFLMAQRLSPRRVYQYGFGVSKHFCPLRRKIPVCDFVRQAKKKWMPDQAVCP